MSTKTKTKDKEELGSGDDSSNSLSPKDPESTPTQPGKGSGGAKSTGRKKVVILGGKGAGAKKIVDLIANEANQQSGKRGRFEFINFDAMTHQQCLDWLEEVNPLLLTAGQNQRLPELRVVCRNILESLKLEEKRNNDYLEPPPKKRSRRDLNNNSNSNSLSEDEKEFDINISTGNINVGRERDAQIEQHQQLQRQMTKFREQLGGFAQLLEEQKKQRRDDVSFLFLYVVALLRIYICCFLWCVIRTHVTLNATFVVLYLCHYFCFISLDMESCIPCSLPSLITCFSLFFMYIFIYICNFYACCPAGFWVVFILRLRAFLGSMSPQESCL